MEITKPVLINYKTVRVIIFMHGWMDNYRSYTTDEITGTAVRLAS